MCRKTAGVFLRYAQGVSMNQVYRKRLPEGVKAVEFFETTDGKWQLNIEGKPVLKTDDIAILERIAENYYARSA